MWSANGRSRRGDVYGHDVRFKNGINAAQQLVLKARSALLCLLTSPKLIWIQFHTGSEHPASKSNLFKLIKQNQQPLQEQYAIFIVHK